MTFSRDHIPNNDIPLTDLEEGDYAVRLQPPFVHDDEKPQRILAPWGSLKKALTALGLFKDSSAYISTTAEDLQAKPGEKFQIDKAGNLLLPESPKDGESIRVADFNKLLENQDNYVIALGTNQTIAKGQLKDDSKVTNAINLRQAQGWRTFDFIYSEPYQNWGVLLDGFYRRFTLTPSADRPYVYTTAADLTITPYAMVGIDQPGNILLWTPSKVGEYATITDARGLLASQDVFVVAPDGQVLGEGVVPADKISNTLNLRNSRGANWFRVAYLGNQKWEMNWVTKNG